MTALAFTGFEGCKKGENDPGLSLKSRKGRLAGEWKLVKAEENSTQTGATAQTKTFDGTNWTANGTKDNTAYTKRVTFEKDGTFKMEETWAAITTTATGVWFFSGKNKEAELKNKEAVIVSVSSVTHAGGTETYTGVTADDMWMLDKLSGKELIVVEEGTEVDSPTGGTATTTTWKNTYTYEQN